MEGKQTIFDTIVTGAIFILCLFLAYALVVQLQGSVDLKIIRLFTGNDSNLLAKWVAVGVLCHILGSIIHVIAICYFPRPWSDDPARECLKSRVIHEIDKCNICPQARDAIINADPDAIFAWVHYSDPRKELIEWGRRKLHYTYLADNWRTSMFLGSGFGLLLGLIVAFADKLYDVLELVLGLRKWPQAFSYLLAVAGIVCLGAVFCFCNRKLKGLRRENQDYDNGMIAMYVTGRIWQELETRFLPKTVDREKIVTNRAGSSEPETTAKKAGANQ